MRLQETGPHAFHNLKGCLSGPGRAEKAPGQWISMSHANCTRLLVLTSVYKQEVLGLVSSAFFRTTSPSKSLPATLSSLRRSRFPTVACSTPLRSHLFGRFRHPSHAQHLSADARSYRIRLLLLQ